MKYELKRGLGLGLEITGIGLIAFGANRLANDFDTQNIISSVYAGITVFTYLVGRNLTDSALEEKIIERIKEK